MYIIIAYTNSIEHHAIARELNIASSVLKGILNIDRNLAKYIINASGTMYG